MGERFDNVYNYVNAWRRELGPLVLFPVSILRDRDAMLRLRGKDAEAKQLLDVAKRARLRVTELLRAGNRAAAEKINAALDVYRREMPGKLLELVASPALPAEEEERLSGWYSKTMEIEDRKTWPTREDQNVVTIPSYNVSRPQEGFLAIQWGQEKKVRGELVLVWTPWQRVGKKPEEWDWAWPDYKRFAQLLNAIRANYRVYSASHMRFRWLPYPGGVDKATVMHGAKNCAIELLKGRFPARARELDRIPLEANGGFGAKQLWAASRVLKRNLRLLDRLGGVMLETRDEDGLWHYAGITRHGKPVPPVDLFDYEGHALDAIPARPKIGEDDVVTYEKIPTYHALRRQYGPSSVVWPTSDGFIVMCNGEDYVAIRPEGVYTAIKRRAKELGVNDVALVTSPFGVEVNAWRRDNRFDPTPVALSKLWKAANFYPRPYCASGTKPGPTADINSAYESAPKAGASDLFALYGFPMAEGQIVVKDPPMAVLSETGLVVAVLDLEKCHPWVRYLVKQPEGVYTTMRLKVWLDAGAIVINSLRLAVIAKKAFPALTRPENARYSPSCGERWEVGHEPSYAQTKHWGREAIGRLVPNGEKHQDYLYVVDDAEAASIIQTLRAKGTLTSFRYEREAVIDKRAEEEKLAEVLKELAEPALVETADDERPGMWVVGYSDSALPKNACYHAHAYWLDYSAAVVDREVFRHPWGSIVRIATDSITLAEGYTFSEHVVYGHEQPGLWKEEKYVPREYCEPVPREVPELGEVEQLAGAYWAPLCGSEPRLHVLEGPPGYGKTYHCLQRLAGHRFVVLTPTRKMRKKFVAAGCKSYTWRWALRPYASFKPDSVRVPRGSLLYLPEIGTWPREDVETLIPWLLENGYRLVADGDREQMRPVRSEPCWPWLDQNPSVSIEWFAEKDHRSKTDELAALKMALRGKTNTQVAQKLREAIGGTDYYDFLEQWHPRDYVYACVHVARAVLHAEMTRIHREKYADVPVRIVYGEKDKERSGEEEYIPLGTPIPENASLAYTTTYTSCQGETAGADETGRLPRVWLSDARASEFFRGALYTGATRVERIEQLGLLEGLPLAPTEKEIARDEYLYGQDDSDIIDC